MRIRRDKEQSGGGHDDGGSMRWLLTYADMITLLMAFFIMMYSMSILNLEKFRQVAISIRSGFAGVVPGQGRSILRSDGQFGVVPSLIEGNTAGVSWKIVKPLQDFIRNDELLSKNSRMFVDERGLVISLVSDAVIFDAGGAKFTPAARRVLDRVAKALVQIPNNIRVEGHTCNLPTRNRAYTSNWELSCSRATNVVRYFVEDCKMKAVRFSAAGYAGVRPMVPNDSSNHRRMNRRVDIVIIRLNDTSHN